MSEFQGAPPTAEEKAQRALARGTEALQRGDAATLGLVLARTQAAHGAGRLGELLQALQTAEGDAFREILRRSP